MFGIIMNARRRGAAKKTSSKEIGILGTAFGLCVLVLGINIHEMRQDKRSLDRLAEDFARAATDLKPQDQDRLKNALANVNLLSVPDTLQTLQALRKNHVRIDFARQALPHQAVAALEPGRLLLSSDPAVYGTCAVAAIVALAEPLITNDPGHRKTGLYAAQHHITSTGASYCNLVPVR